MISNIVAFDFGTKSIGVAVGTHYNDSGAAYPLQALKAQDGIPDWMLVKHILNKWQPDKVVVGLPLNIDGGAEQSIIANVHKFANRIHGRFGITVKLHDERLSTVEARTRLFEYGGFRALSKNNIDSVSAMIILESFFEQKY